MNQVNKGQIYIHEIFVVLIVVVVIVFLELTIVNNYMSNKKSSVYETKTLREMIFVEKLVSDCNFLAKKDNVCYRNNLNLNNNIDYEHQKISSIKIDGKNQLSFKKDVRCYKRGVIYNKKFCVLEVCFYDQ